MDREEPSRHHYVWGGREDPSSDSSNRSSGDVRKGLGVAEVQFLSSSGVESSVESGEKSGGSLNVSRLSLADELEKSEYEFVVEPLDKARNSVSPRRQHEDQQDDIAPSRDEVLPSVGSAKHILGMCKPCIFAPRKTGCDKGRDCEWCHLPHVRAIKNRLSSTQRKRYQGLLEQICSQSEARRHHYVWGGIEDPSSDSSSRESGNDRKRQGQLEVQFMSYSAVESSKESSEESGGSMNVTCESRIHQPEKSQYELGEKPLDRGQSSVGSRGQDEGQQDDDAPNRAEVSPPSLSGGSASHILGMCEPSFSEPRRTGFDRARREQDEEQQDDRAPSENHILPSVGSANHIFGTCKPCFFAPRKAGCDKGRDCDRCHLPHDKKKQEKPS